MFGGWKKPFIEILKHIDKYTDYEKILIWIMSEFLENCKKSDGRNLSNYRSSEFLAYYFQLITDDKFNNEKQIFFKSKMGKELIAKDMEYEKILSLYAYDYLEKGYQQKLIDYFEDNYTIKTDPYFIIKLKTDKLKNRVLNIIKDYDIMNYTSFDYSILSFVKYLNNFKLLNENDKKDISTMIIEKYKILQKNADYFRQYIDNVYIKLQNEFFFILLELFIDKKELQKYPELNETYMELETNYKKQHAELFEFKWLYIDKLQEFRQYFIETITCFSYLHLETEYLYIIDTCLLKIITQDSREFEAVIEQFIIIYENGYADNIFNNKTTTGILIQMLNKFKKDIPFCYDDLFIKEQMKKLAKHMKKIGIEDNVVDYWVKEK